MAYHTLLNRLYTCLSVHQSCGRITSSDIVLKAKAIEINVFNELRRFKQLFNSGFAAGFLA